jgi:hypothetical protein
MVKKGADEFNECMREVIANTNKGRKIISDSIRETSAMMEVDSIEEIGDNKETSMEAVERTVKELQDLILRNIEEPLKHRWGASWGMEEVRKSPIDVKPITDNIVDEVPVKQYNDGIGDGRVADKALSPIQQARTEASERFNMHPTAINNMMSYFDSPNIDTISLGAKYVPETDNMIDVLTVYTDPQTGHRTEMQSVHKAENGRMLRRSKLRVWDPKTMEYVK